MSSFNQKDTDSGSKRLRYLLIFSIIWILFSGSFLIFMPPDFMGYICLGFFLLIGLAMLVYVIMAYISRARLGHPELQISLQALPVGETFTVDFFHTFPRAVEVESITIKLVFRETATYQQGTDTRTVRDNRDIQVFEIPAGHFSPNSSIREQYQMQIPPGAMHSLDVRRNKLQWFVELRMVLDGWPDVTEEYELEVMPQLAGR